MLLRLANHPAMNCILLGASPDFLTVAEGTLRLCVWLGYRELIDDHTTCP